MMKNMTIYLAEITKTVDYVTGIGHAGTDITVEREAFDSMEKAEAFLISHGMKTSSVGLWRNPINPFDYEVYITTMEVK